MTTFTFNNASPEDVPLTAEALYCQPVTQSARQEGDLGWPVFQMQTATTSTLIKVRPTDYGERVDFDPDMFGSGTPAGSTSLSVLDFVGAKGEYTGEVEGEFAFNGAGNLHVYGKPTRTVRLSGLAQLGNGTSFVRHFHGYAVIDDRYLWSDTPSVYRVRGELETARRRRARQSQPSAIYHEFKELASWLKEFSLEELAEIVGVGRTTPYSWARGAQPRKPEAVRKLHQLRAAVRAVRQRLGDDGLREWLHQGSPSPIKLLQEKNLDRFGKTADDVIFPRSDRPIPRLDAAAPPDRELRRASPESTTPLRRASRARGRRLAR